MKIKKWDKVKVNDDYGFGAGNVKYVIRIKKQKDGYNYTLGGVGSNPDYGVIYKRNQFKKIKI